MMLDAKVVSWWMGALSKLGPQGELEGEEL